MTSQSETADMGSPRGSIHPSQELKTQRAMPPLSVDIEEPASKSIPSYGAIPAGLAGPDQPGHPDLNSPDLASPRVRNKFIPSDPHEQCAVCQGRASGKHFGAYTCESCKLFFLRILKIKTGSGRPLVCANSNTCPVTVNTRSMCRACRFKKCCDAGMAKEKCVYGRNARLIQSHCGASSSPTLTGSNDKSGFAYGSSPGRGDSKLTAPSVCSTNDVTFSCATSSATTTCFMNHVQNLDPNSVYSKRRVASIPSVIQSIQTPSFHLFSQVSTGNQHLNNQQIYLNSQNHPNFFHRYPQNGTANANCTTAPSVIPAPPSLIPSRSMPVPPPPLVVPPAHPHQTLKSLPTGNIPLPKLIEYHLSQTYPPFYPTTSTVVTSSASTSHAHVRRPPESEKNSPKSDNSDDSGYCQTDSSYEASSYSTKSKHPKSSHEVARSLHNSVSSGSSSSLSSASPRSFGRASESSSSGEDSPPRFTLCDKDQSSKNPDNVNFLLPDVYLHRDMDKDYFPELPQFSEDIASDSVLTTPYTSSQHEEEVAMALIMTKLTPDENIRLENWVEIFEEYGKHWLPKLQEQMEQFTSKHIHISLLEFDCQFLLSTFIPKNLSFRPLVQSHDISAEVLKPILFGSIFGLNLPVHHVVCKGDVRFPRIVNEMLKVECRVIKTLKLLHLSQLELALITNYLSLKTFRRHLPFVCATEMRREESFMDNIFITVMEVNKRERVVRAIHLVCEFTLAKSDVFFKFLQSGANEIC